MDIFGNWTWSLSPPPPTTCAGKPRGAHKVLWVSGCPGDPKIGKTWVKESLMGTQRYPRARVLVTTGGVQVGGDVSVQSEQECGALWETNVSLSAFFFYGKQNENDNQTETNPALT